MNLYQRFKNKIKKSCPHFFAKMKAAKKPFNPFLHWIRLGPVGYETIPIFIGSVKRKIFPNLPSRFSRVKSLKDIHKGEKIFIVATGPSLTTEDLNMLKGHLCMGMNSIVLSYDKTDWRPDYYVAVDTGPIQNIIEHNNWSSYDLMHSIDPSRIIFPHHFKSVFELPKEVILLPVILYHPKKDLADKLKFSGDCFVRVWESCTVMYTCLQLAAYMGCSEIYLLGADCNYTGTNDHAFDFKLNEEMRLEQLNKGKILSLEMIASYQAAKKYADAHGIKIFNATRGGKLEVFPRVSLEEALKD